LGFWAILSLIRNGMAGSLPDGFSGSWKSVRGDLNNLDREINNIDI
jgi:hypothetical protein